MNKAHKYQKLSFALRRYSVYTVLALGFVVLVGRAYDLQVLRHEFLNWQGSARQQRVVKEQAHRGVITDRNGEPLAISTPVDSVWVVPEAFLKQAQALPQLAAKLKLDATVLGTKLRSNLEREFVYVKRHLPPAEAAAVKAMGLEGVYLQREYKRYYPAAEVTGHVLGFTNIDDQGQEGIELAYDDWLVGQPGLKRVLRDRLGRIIEDIDSIEVARPGRDLQLSLDKRLQYLAYRELKKAVQQHQAKSGSLVLLDSYNGEVLAMVNQPAFNPNNRNEMRGELYRNRAVTDLFEPGSSMKPFTVAAALEYRYVKPSAQLDTSPGYIKVGSHKIRDFKNYGVLTLEGVFRHSSNVAASKLALSMPASELWHTYNRFGFGRETDSGFPGEAVGVLNHFDQWRQLEQATMAFGYGLSTTTLQLARAYSVLANGGYEFPVTFVRQIEEAAGRRVLSEVSASQLRQLMSSVVNEGGTGRRAHVPGYRIAGKTGTVRKSTAQGYSDSAHLSIFAGMAPLSNPRLVLVVVIDQPQGDQYYGGQVAAPVFASVMADALRLFNIAPDDPQTLLVEASASTGGRT